MHTRSNKSSGVVLYAVPRSSTRGTAQCPPQRRRTGGVAALRDRASLQVRWAPRQAVTAPAPAQAPCIAPTPRPTADPLPVGPRAYQQQAQRCPPAEWHRGRCGGAQVQCRAPAPMQNGCALIGTVPHVSRSRQRLSVADMPVSSQAWQQTTQGGDRGPPPFPNNRCHAYEIPTSEASSRLSLSNTRHPVFFEHAPSSFSNTHLPCFLARTLLDSSLTCGPNSTLSLAPSLLAPVYHLPKPKLSSRTSTSLRAPPGRNCSQGPSSTLPLLRLPEQTYDSGTSITTRPCEDHIPAHSCNFAQSSAVVLGLPTTSLCQHNPRAQAHIPPGRVCMPAHTQHTQTLSPENTPAHKEPRAEAQAHARPSAVIMLAYTSPERKPPPLHQCSSASPGQPTPSQPSCIPSSHA
eukprot:358456-Chlamydomonas_euryale.AAC.5